MISAPTTRSGTGEDRFQLRRLNPLGPFGERILHALSTPYDEHAPAFQHLWAVKSAELPPALCPAELQEHLPPAGMHVSKARHVENQLVYHDPCCQRGWEWSAQRLPGVRCSASCSLFTNGSVSVGGGLTHATSSSLRSHTVREPMVRVPGRLGTASASAGGTRYRPREKPIGRRTGR